MATKTRKGARNYKAQPQTAQQTEQTLKASISEATEALVKEMQAGKSDRFMALIQFASQFYQYSWGNQMLIAMQCPHATYVAGYKTWERMGYHVAKGQHGIRILAPRPYKKVKDDGEEESHVFFASVPVFDASQLNPDELAAKPLPKFHVDLGSDEQSDQMCARIEHAIRASGITLEDRDIDGDVQGYSKGGYIAIRRGLSSRNRLRTLIHEWAHELLHWTQDAKEIARGVKECHAEAASYIVLARYGIHNEFASDYLQSWGNTPDTLMAELAMVQRAATTIIEALDGKHVEQEAA